MSCKLARIHSCGVCVCVVVAGGGGGGDKYQISSFNCTVLAAIMVVNKTSSRLP